MKKSIILFSLLVSVTMIAQAKPCRVVLVGDGTMANLEQIDSADQYGWGQVLPTYLTDDCQVLNRAQVGLSITKLYSNGQWSGLMDVLCKGDIVLIQLGVNESHEWDGDSYCPIDQFVETLRQMIEEVSKTGAKAVLMTPIAQPYRNNGEWVLTFGGYPKALHHVARAENIPIVEMEIATRDWLKAHSDEQLAQYFYRLDPTEKQQEYRLTRDGALQIAQIAASLLMIIPDLKLDKQIVLTEGRTVRFAEN